MNVSVNKVVEEPYTEMTEKTVITGKAPKKLISQIRASARSAAMPTANLGASENEKIGIRY